jgi:hypothetical protein
MDVGALYPLVTEAIRRAEALEDSGAPDVRRAFSEVSQLEEQIAILLPLSDYEGVIARRGAVRAAIKAHEFGRAQKLAAGYKAEDGIDDALAADLAALKAQASEALALETMLQELTASIQELFVTQRSGLHELTNEVAVLGQMAEAPYDKMGNATLARLGVTVRDLISKTRELNVDIWRRTRQLNGEVAELQLALLGAQDRIGKQEGQPRASTRRRTHE